MQHEDITKRNKGILYGKICPYCMKPSDYVDSSCIYGKSYGMIYRCDDCDAHVGVHRGTNKALGRLANSELRQAKKIAHSWFDPLWRKAIKQGRKRKEARNAAYAWLAKELGIEVKYCHIGMFDVNTCIKAIEICKKHYK